MKKLSRFQLILLTVFGSLGVAGVLIFALAVSTSNQGALGSVVIWGTFDDSRINAVIRAAADSDGRLSQVTYVRKNPATYESDLADAIASGAGPDLFFLRQDQAFRDAAKTAHISPSSLSPSQFDSTFLEAASPFLTQDGAIGVPLVSDPLMLFWNRDLLEKAGFTEPPHFWDEFPGVVQTITVQADAGTIKKSGAALGSYVNIGNAKDVVSTLILQAGGGIVGQDSAGKLVPEMSGREKGNAGQAPALAALRFYTEFADPSKDDYSWNRSLPEAQTAFAQGDVGLYIGHASEVALIKQKNPNLNFAMAPLPQVRASVIPTNTARTYALAIARGSKNPQGALTVAYILAGPSVSQGFATVLGMASALRSVVSADSFQAKPSSASATQLPLQKVIAQSPKSTQDLINSQASIARAWIDPDPGQTDALFRAMIEDTVSGAVKPTDALSRADKQMNQILSI